MRQCVALPVSVVCRGLRRGARLVQETAEEQGSGQRQGYGVGHPAVSYTHLTLPTKCQV